MSNENKIKTSKTPVGQRMDLVIPLVEELAKIKAFPMCLIGAKIKDKKKKLIYFHFATIDDKPETKELLYKAAKAIVENLKEKYESSDSPSDYMRGYDQGYYDAHLEYASKPNHF